VPEPLRRTPKAISKASSGTSNTMSYRVQSVVPLIGLLKSACCRRPTPVNDH
jgi:hypothetical protein